jgi:hypothetical protein
MDNTPKTRQEQGKGKGAKTKMIFNQKNVRIRTAVAATASSKKR